MSVVSRPPELAEVLEENALLRVENARLLKENERLKDQADEAWVAATHSGEIALAAEARIEAALALHVRADVTGTGYCLACGKDWPCPTVKALRGENDEH